MADYSESAIRQLSQRLEVDAVFLLECLQDSVIEVFQTEDRLELGSGTVLRLRRLERICRTFSVDIPAAIHLLSLSERVAELENELQLLRKGEHHS